LSLYDGSQLETLDEATTARLRSRAASSASFVLLSGRLNGSSDGTWAAETLLTTSQWKDSGDLNHDVGFAVMAKNSSGQSLTQVVGSYPIAFHLGYELSFDSNGYPAANPYDGQDRTAAQGPPARTTTGRTTTA